MSNFLDLKKFFFLLLTFTSVFNRIRADPPCLAPTAANGVFSKLSAVSKYVSFDSKVQNPFSFNYDAAKELCEMAGLEMAEVTSIIDMTSLTKFIQDSKTCYWIGMNDIKEEGKFVESDGISKIKFQAFGGDNPSDKSGSNDCVQLVRKNQYLQMQNVNCTLQAGVICQFIKGTFCYVNSFQRSYSDNIGDDFGLIRLGKSQHFFVSTEQKPRSIAFETCLNAKKYLVEFNNANSSQDLADLMKNYLSVTPMDPETTFWTSGTMIKDITGKFSGEIHWEATEKIYDAFSNLNNISFALRKPKDNSENQNCLDVSFENFAYSQSSYKPIWGAGNCALPKFFICMDLAMTTLENHIRLGRKIKLEGLNSDDNHGDPPSGKNGCSKPVTYIDSLKMNLSTIFSMEDTLNLMMFTLKNNLKSGNVKIKLPKSISWKRDLVEMIFDIFKKAISSDYVPYEYLNIARELSLMYQANFPNEKRIGGGGQWNEVQKVLKECLKSIKPYQFSTIGLKLQFQKYSEDSKNEIFVPEEKADWLKVDLILDTFWFVFSFSLGACYHNANQQSPLSWSSQYYTLFFLDFMEKLTQKWSSEDDSAVLKYSLIFGDFDLILAINNLRTSVTSAYVQSKIVDRQIIRPIYREFMTLFPNLKTGKVLNFHDFN